MPLDWDKLRVFHAAAEAGSFTHAGEKLHMSQSAVSRQVSALEQEVGVTLFNRHARGLVLTEQGELLFRTANQVFVKLETVKSQLSDSKDKPSGHLRVTTTVGLGSGWLTYRVQDFLELYPDVQLHLMLSNEELDLNMREADCAIRLRQPQQPDLIQRKLFTVHFHIFASPGYLNKYGRPEKLDDLDNHRLIGFGEPAPAYLMEMRSFLTLGRPAGQSAGADPGYQLDHVDQAGGTARYWNCHVARLCGRTGCRPRAIAHRCRVAEFRHLFRLSRSDAFQRQTAGFSGFSVLEGAKLGILSSPCAGICFEFVRAMQKMHRCIAQ